MREFKQQEHERKTSLQRVSLSGFTATFLEHSRSIHTRKTAESNATALAEFQRIVGDIPLHKIVARDIELFLARKREEASVWKARKYYLALAAAFETAKRWGHVSMNPFRDVPKPKPPEVQPVFFTAEDFRRLLLVVQDRDFADLLVTAVLTGMRLGELLSLEWSAVDFTGRFIGIRNTGTITTKSKRGRVIPMNNELCRLLQTRRVRTSNESRLVFHSHGHQISQSSVSHRMKKAVRAAGLDDRLHFHSARHAFASWLVQAGVSLYEVQKLLGDSSPPVTEVYSHLQPEHLHGTVNKITLSLN
jgi:integrase